MEVFLEKAIRILQVTSLGAADLLQFPNDRTLPPHPLTEGQVVRLSVAWSCHPQTPFT